MYTSTFPTLLLDAWGLIARCIAILLLADRVNVSEQQESFLPLIYFPSNNIIILWWIVCRNKPVVIYFRIKVNSEL